MFSSSHSFSHHITSQAVLIEACRIESALKQAGFDPFDFDLGDLARHRLVGEAMADVSACGVEVRQKHWARRPGGGIDLVIEVASMTDLVATKLALG